MKVHCRDKGRSVEGAPVSLCGVPDAICAIPKALIDCQLCIRQMERDALAYRPKAWASPNQIAPIESPMWSTWRAAIELYFIFKDDGYPMKSTSDPNRFGSMHSGGASANGDRAQGIAGDLAVVGKLLEEAFEQPFPLESGFHITGYTASKIFEYRTVGRDREVDPNGKTKKLLRRVEWPAQDIVNAVNEVGMEQITISDLNAICRHGAIHIESGLHSRGLISYLEHGRN